MQEGSQPGSLLSSQPREGGRFLHPQGTASSRPLSRSLFSAMARPELAWLAGFLRDFPGLLGPAEPPPWTASTTALLRPDEAAGELSERARGFLGRR